MTGRNYFIGPREKRLSGVYYLVGGAEVVRRGRRPRYDGGFLERLAEALGVDTSKPYTRDCASDGHSFDSAINHKIWCSICGRTKAEIDARAVAGEYQYDAIKYLDR